MFDNLKIKYGLSLEESIDITKEVIEKHYNNTVLYINKNTNFNNFKEDPYPNFVKKVFICLKDKIKYFNEYLEEDIIINFGSDSFFNIKYGLSLDQSIDVTNEFIDKFFFEDDILYINKNENFDFTNIYSASIKNNIYICFDYIIIDYPENFKTDIIVVYIDINNVKCTNNIDNNCNIIMYPHVKYIEEDGGINVLYNLCKLLDDNNKNVRIYNSCGRYKNHNYNKYYNYDFLIEDSIIIYCEGIPYTPLKGKCIIRWLLSELGKNVPKEYITTWNATDLFYSFNYDVNYKSLPILYLNPKIKNTKSIRNNTCCHTFRKSFYHNKINLIHPNNSNEIKDVSFDTCIDIFNSHEHFISYDPLTFLNIIASICGCISIVYPIENVTKIQWIKTTSFYPYMVDKKLDNIYGIAYGDSYSEIEWSKNTIHLAEEQWKNLVEWYHEKYFIPFMKNIS